MKEEDDGQPGFKGKSIHPMQPVVMEDGVARFQRNPLVRQLLDESTERGRGLNKLVVDAYSMENGADHLQHLYQLIGYSVSGYGGLSGHNRGVARRADKLVDKLMEAHNAALAQKQNAEVQSQLPPWEE